MSSHFNGMRILVAGGAGFLGGALCDRLIQQGHFVMCVDALFTGTIQRVQHLLDHPRFVFLQQDITAHLHVEQVDQIYNLACPASPLHYQKDPVKTIETNVVGTKNLLALAARHQARFLLASTSEVYGTPEQKPQREEYRGNVNTMGPRACYDEGKRCAEALTYAYSTHHHVDTRIARIFNTYGPGMQVDDGRVVSNFIVQSLNDVPITIYGDGRQTRSFCYVDDMIEGLLALMASDCTSPVNLGSDHEISIGELAVLVGEILGKHVPILTLPAQTDDPRERRPDLTKCRRILDWQARTLLSVGLAKTAAYFRQAREASHG